MPRLIVNADDFGLTPGINRAVLELHLAGALSSATLMATGRALEEAVAISHTHPSLGVGCHVVLIDGTPISRPAGIPSLLGPDRTNFRDKLTSFVFALASGRIREDDVAQEAVAQIRRLQELGIPVTHVDTHKHTHMFPVVVKGLLRAAEQCGVAAVRNPFEQDWSLSAAGASALRLLEVRGLRLRYQQQFHRLASASLTTSGAIGVAATGSMNRRMLDRWLKTIPDGVWELVTHPGYQDEALAAQRTRLRATREQELRALATAIPEALLAQPDLQLVHFGSLSERSA